MASTLRFSYAPGLTLWAACRNAASEVLDVAGAGGLFEAWGTAADYDIACTKSQSLYELDMADFTGLAAGWYRIQVFVRAGATASNDDVLAVEFESVYWNGVDTVGEFRLLNILDSLDVSITAILADTGTTLEDHLTDIKGTGFVKDTDSLVDVAHIGADSDTLETLSDQIDDIATAAGQPALGD